jgi:hypothetical protein
MPMNLTENHYTPLEPPVKWGQQRRLEFVDFRLRWEGCINRKALMDFFGISTPQASLDIAKYIELAPENLHYDRTSRMYLAQESFVQIFPTSQPDLYLDRMLANARNEPDSLGFLGWRPPTAAVPIPGRRVDGDVLAKIVGAIREKQDIFVRYQSITSSAETGRWLSPHALAHDGYRWHVRAYCHLRKEFRDFLIARTLRVDDARVGSIDTNSDTAWSNVVQLVLAPHPGLSAAATRVVEEDYGMEKGEAKLECREALLFYLLRQLNLLPRAEASTPEAQQVILTNANDILPLLKKQTPTPVKAGKRNPSPGHSD